MGYASPMKPPDRKVVHEEGRQINKFAGKVYHVLSERNLPFKLLLGNGSLHAGTISIGSSRLSVVPVFLSS